MLRVAVVAIALGSLSAVGGELKGVTLPDTVTLEGKTLKLNGMGLRTKAIFKVYVAGLYVENPVTDSDAIFAADSLRRVDLVMKRDLKKSTISEAISAGIERNSKDQLPALKERLDCVIAGVPDLSEGQVLSIFYIPGKGTSVQGAGGPAVTVEGKDFADAIFKVWLGKNPVDDDLKKSLLGGK